jgi:hypothetical protein
MVDVIITSPLRSVGVMIYARWPSTSDIIIIVQASNRLNYKDEDHISEVSGPIASFPLRLVCCLGSGIEVQAFLSYLFFI